MPSWKKIIVSGSNISQLNNDSGYARTGSTNTFYADQTINGDLIVTGSITALQYIVSSSVIYITQSNYSGSTIFGNSLDDTHQFTGSVYITGSTTQIGNNDLLGNTTLSGSIIISGALGTNNPTIKIYGDTQLDGYIRFDPVTTNIDTSISASYIYVSGSTNDLYFSQNGSGYNNVTRLRWLEGNLYTGLLHGGLITATLGTNTYQVGSGSGIIVNLNTSIGDDPYPTVQFLEWGNLTNTINTLSSSFDQQFVAIDSTANILAQGTPYNNGDYNTYIPIGIVLHQNRSTINGVQTFPGVAYGWKQRSFDFIKAFGALKISGYTLAQSGSSTRGLLLSGGTAWVDGRNYTVDPNQPSYITEAVGTPTSKIFRYYQSGSNWQSNWGYNTNAGAGFTAIDPTQYSNAGTLTAVDSNKWSIQKVFYFPNSATKALFVYYGNAQYANETDALAAVATETFTEAPNTAASAIYVGYMLLRNDADFTVPASFTFYQAGLFRGSGGSGGGSGGGATSLAGLTDVSLTSLVNGDLLAYNTATALWRNTKTLSGSFVLTGSLNVTGSIRATLGFTGSLFGTASRATTASLALSASTVLVNTVGSSPEYGVVFAPSGQFSTLTINQEQFTFISDSTSTLKLLQPDVGRSVVFNFGSPTTTAARGNRLNVSGSINIYRAGADGEDNLLVLSGSSYPIMRVRDAAGTSDTVFDVWYQKAGIPFKAFAVSTTGQISVPDISNINQQHVVMFNSASGQLTYVTASTFSGGGGGATFPYTGTAVISGSLIVTGSVRITGSLNAPSITGSLFGTASYVTGSIFTSTNPALSASFATTSSFAVSSSRSISSSFATTSSFALTASYLVGGGTTSAGGNPNEIQYNSGGVLQGVPVLIYDGTTLRGTGSFSGSLTGALIGTSSWATNALTASYITGSIFTSTNRALSASFALSSSLATSASYITGSVFTSANPVLSASYALTASYALNGGGIGTPGGSNTQIQFNSASAFSGSTNFTFDYTTNTLYITGSLITSQSGFPYTAIDTKNGYLYGPSGFGGRTVVVDWRNTLLYDNVGQLSLYWANRTMYDTNGSTVLNYQNIATPNGVRLYGTSSYALTASIAGFATTSSFALNSGTVVTQSFSSLSTWTFTHNLNRREVVIEVFDSSYNQIIPQTLNLTDANTATISFPSNTSGFAVATFGGATTNYLFQTASIDNINVGTTSTETYNYIVRAQELEQSKHSTINIYNSINFI